MSNWIEVNGAKIDKEFFDANVREAKGYDWMEVHVADLTEHIHCMICGMAIDPKSTTTTRVYKSKGVHICAYCYDYIVGRK